MSKFDWIDFSYSWNQEWKSKPVLKEFHSSTTNEISKYLRGRKFQFPKIFLWMRSDGISSFSFTNDVFHVERNFDFEAYEKSTECDKLSIFSKWVLEALFDSGVGLIKFSEIDNIAQHLVDKKYIYVRTDNIKLNGKKRNNRCQVTFIHSPYSVTSKIVCRCADFDFSLPDGLFRRDELDYAGSVINIETEVD